MLGQSPVGAPWAGVLPCRDTLSWCSPQVTSALQKQGLFPASPPAQLLPWLKLIDLSSAPEPSGCKSMGNFPSFPEPVTGPRTLNPDPGPASMCSQHPWPPQGPDSALSFHVRARGRLRKAPQPRLAGWDWITDSRNRGTIHVGKAFGGSGSSCLMFTPQWGVGLCVRGAGGREVWSCLG